MDRLSQLLESGLPLTEIDRIAWWRSLPRADDIPELKKRIDPLTETGLMNYWGDELSRANDYYKKTHGPNGSVKKQPPRWIEFFKWKYGSEITLPKYFEQLEQDQQLEYERDFQTFAQSTAEIPA